MEDVGLEGERRPCHSGTELIPPLVPHNPWFNRDTAACCSTAARDFIMIASLFVRAANKSILDVIRNGLRLPLKAGFRLTLAGDLSGATMKGFVFELHGIFVKSSISSRVICGL